MLQEPLSGSLPLLGHWGSLALSLDDVKSDLWELAIDKALIARGKEAKCVIARWCLRWDRHGHTVAIAAD